MSCYICGKDVDLIHRPDSEECPCPDCGHYRLSGTAIKLYEDNDWKFDIEITRQWLASQQGRGIVPLIDSDTAKLLIASR